MSIITKGIILAGDSGDKLYPLTMGVPKQLLPIYDKPMIFYPIKTLVEVGITDILIITSPKYISAFIQALGDGSEYGSKFTYATQTSPEGAAQALTIGAHFVGNEPVCMVTGDCIIEGEGVTEKLRKALRAAKNSGQATIFISQDYDPNQYGVAILDKAGKCHSVEGKPSSPQHYSITGLYVFPKGVADCVKVLDKSERGRYEVTSLNQAYLAANKLQVQKFGEDILWFDTNTFNSLLRVSNYMQSKDKKRL